MVVFNQVPAVFRDGSMERQIDRLLEDAVQSVNSWASSWEPQCNVFENEQGLTMQLALPGMEADRIRVQVEQTNSASAASGNGRGPKRAPGMRETLKKEHLPVRSGYRPIPIIPTCRLPIGKACSRSPSRSVKKPSRAKSRSHASRG